MVASPQPSIRFNPLTALLWLLVATGVIFLLWNIITRISGQNLPISTPTANQTQVHQTIAVMLTAQSTIPLSPATPTGTPSLTPRLTPTSRTVIPSRLATSTPTSGSFTEGPTARCDRAAAGSPIDITIPDDSELAPGESFIKTWRLVNAGTCTWTKDYSATFFYGDRMDAPEVVPLKGEVAPQQDMEISIEMLAPQSPGTYQANWKLRNENGDLFGIGPNADAPFWVRIIVYEINTETPIASITPTIMPTDVITPTETPTGDTTGKVTLIPGDAIDLDSLTLNGGGVDLDYQMDTDGKHWLTPVGGAALAIFGSQPPTLPDCQAVELGDSPVPVESMPVGSYLCYLTGEARPGRAFVEGLDPGTFSLTLDLITWAVP